MAYDIVGLKEDQQLCRLGAIVLEGTSHPIRQGYVSDSDLCYRFHEGKQLSPEELKVLEDRNQPDIVYNECVQVVERTIGQYTRQRLVNTLVGRNAPVDDTLASDLSELHRFVDQDTDYLFAEKEMVRDGLIGGYGVIECGVESETLGKPRIFIDEQDPFTIAADPFCRRYDWNAARGGARYVLRFPWLDLDEGKARWPKYAKKLDACFNSHSPAKNVFSFLDPSVTQELQFQFFDRERRLIRPVEIWFKQREQQEVVVTPFGILGDEHDAALKKKALKLIPTARKEMMMRDCMYMSVVCGDVLIQKATPSPYKTNLFPFIPFYCHRKKNGQPYGRVLRLIDPNREINSRRSRALYMLNNRLSIYEKGAVVNQNELAEELAKSDGQIRLENGKFDKFMMQQNQDIGQANLQMLQEAKSELQHLAGEDYLAPSSEMRSGAGVQQQQLPYHLSQVDIFDNLRRTRKIKTNLITSYIQQFYDEDMIFQITDDQEKAKTVTISKAQFSEIKNRVFDVIVKEQPDYATKEEEAYANLQTTLPQVAQYGPQWGQILVMNSPLREKEKTLKLLESMAPAPPTPAKAAITVVWSELDPQEKAAFAVQLGMPDLAQYEAQQGRGPARDDKATLEINKKLIDAGVKSGIENSKLQLQEQQSLADAQLRLKEMNDAREQSLNEQTTEGAPSESSASN